MPTSQYISVKTSFWGWHKYENAPEEVKFLREAHPHTFGVEVAMFVDHTDRDLEFFIMKKKIDEYLKVVYEGSSENNPFKLSCEEIAKRLGEWLIGKGYKVFNVEVSEDYQNVGGVLFN